MARMDVKEAIGIAKAYFANLYDDEHIRNVGLEEAKFQGNCVLIKSALPGSVIPAKAVIQPPSGGVGG